MPYQIYEKDVRVSKVVRWDKSVCTFMSKKLFQNKLFKHMHNHVCNNNMYVYHHLYWYRYVFSICKEFIFLSFWSIIKQLLLENWKDRFKRLIIIFKGSRLIFFNTSFFNKRDKIIYINAGLKLIIWHSRSKV